jgi:Queuine tRNA-ribosyltransferase
MRKSLKFMEKKGPFHFIPEWDDWVDPEYDFINDIQKNKGWEQSVYAHELINPPAYDGLLVSKVVEEKSKIKRERIRKLGIHKAMRVSKDFPVMGDCGAFGYFKEKTPPYSSEEIFDYYSKGGFDIGVSIDHLIPGESFGDKDFRYKITLDNAKEFIKIHKTNKPDWIAMGAVQGWNPETYAEAAFKMWKMGYEYLALGGLVRERTKNVLEIVKEVRKSIDKNVCIHLFGVARGQILENLRELNVTSVDSASSLRRAWLGSKDNYHTEEKDYCAIRVPKPGNRGPLKNLSEYKLKKAESLQNLNLKNLRLYDKNKISLEEVEKSLKDYEKLYLKEKQKSRIENYLETLREKPWEKCKCPICKSDGIEVIIFRGNNRNRRRGFHNTWVLHEKFLKTRKKPQ